MFIQAEFTIAKCWKQPKCPSINEWIPKLWHIYTKEYYAVERKKDLLPFATAWMELESIILSEIRHHTFILAIYTHTYFFFFREGKGGRKRGKETSM